MRLAWEDALAVLASIAEPTDYALREHAYLWLSADHREPLGLDMEYGKVHDALLALDDLGYIESGEWQYSSGPGLSINNVRVTGRGMQALGQWPALHTAMTPASLAHLLEALAPYAADDEKAGRLREAAVAARQMTAQSLRRAVISGGVALVRYKLGLPG
jgi:hypothetical protein